MKGVSLGKVEDAPRLIADVLVVGFGSFEAFEPFDDAERYGEGYDFIDGLEQHLVEHEQGHHAPRDHSAEGQREEDEGVG